MLQAFPWGFQRSKVWMRWARAKVRCEEGGDQELLGKQSWRSVESARLPLMCAGTPVFIISKHKRREFLCMSKDHQKIHPASPSTILPYKFQFLREDPRGHWKRRLFDWYFRRHIFYGDPAIKSYGVKNLPDFESLIWFVAKKKDIAGLFANIRTFS